MGPGVAVEMKRHSVCLHSIVDGRDGIVGHPGHVAGRGGQTVPKGSSPAGSSLVGRFRWGVVMLGCQVDGWSDGAQNRGIL